MSSSKKQGRVSNPVYLEESVCNRFKDAEVMYEAEQDAEVTYEEEQKTVNSSRMSLANVGQELTQNFLGPWQREREAANGVGRVSLSTCEIMGFLQLKKGSV
ncbi:hypothetical protein DUI87_30498 [Hirundo rustica rustica]|uniref:Uncharacterized protein n=1 Tax=Hirundo rustica rustica TaxID=333673 RepID=A0A3M0IWX9_HIRRU|nr:hypothetical protein DUI87_30498 [Hirundo rustica rustica]